MSEILVMSTTTLHTSARINESILSIIKGTSVSHSPEHKSNSPILTWAWLTQDLSGLGSRLEDWSLACRTLPKKSCRWQADLQKKNDQQRFVLPWELTLTVENKNSTGCVTTTTTVSVAQPLLAHSVPELTSFPKTQLSLKLLRSTAFSLRFWSTGTWSAEISLSFICGDENSVNPLQQRHKAWTLWTNTLWLFGMWNVDGVSLTTHDHHSTTYKTLTSLPNF